MHAAMYDKLDVGDPLSRMQSSRAASTDIVTCDELSHMIEIEFPKIEHKTCRPSKIQKSTARR